MATMNDAPDGHDAEIESEEVDSPSTDTVDQRTRSAGKSVAAFRTISEVSSDLDVPQHVLRFWESKFTQLRPLKRGGGRRYYRPEDVALLRRIHALLYREGYTIKGVQRLLRTPRRAEKEDIAGEAAIEVASPRPVEPSIPGMDLPKVQKSDALLRDILSELKILRGLLN